MLELGDVGGAVDNCYCGHCLQRFCTVAINILAQVWQLQVLLNKTLQLQSKHEGTTTYSKEGNSSILPVKLFNRGPSGAYTPLIGFPVSLTEVCRTEAVQSKGTASPLEEANVVCSPHVIGTLAFDPA